MGSLDARINLWGDGYSAWGEYSSRYIEHKNIFGGLTGITLPSRAEDLFVVIALSGGKRPRGHPGQALSN